MFGVHRKGGNCIQRSRYRIKPLRGHHGALRGRRDLPGWEEAVAGSTPAVPIRATARKEGENMTDHEKEVLERFAKLVEEADEETKRNMLYFCEGAVSLWATLKEKEEKTA